MSSARRRPGKRGARAARPRTRKDPRTSSPPKKPERPAARAARPPARIATGWPPSAARAANTKHVGGGNQPVSSPQFVNAGWLQRADQLLDPCLRERDV